MKYCGIGMKYCGIGMKYCAIGMKFFGLEKINFLSSLKFNFYGAFFSEFYNMKHVYFY